MFETWGLSEANEYYSGFLSNLRLPWKTESALKFFALLNIFFVILKFWVTCTCPENRVTLEFFTVLNILFTFRIFEQLALALKNRGCPEFTVLNVYFFYSAFLSNLRLPWNFSLYWNIFYDSGFLRNLRLPWKTELPWNFSLYWNIFYDSGFLRNLWLPWKQSWPWKFLSPVGWPLPPTPRLVRLWLEWLNSTKQAFLQWWLSSLN